MLRAQVREMKMRRLLITLILLSHSQGFGAETVVEMLNQQGSEMMVFSRKLVHVEQGDSVLWKATDKTHSVAFIKGAIPKGVPLFKSPFNVDGRFVFKVPGIYVYKCVGHYGMGMIGVVVVGQTDTIWNKLKICPCSQQRKGSWPASCQSSPTIKRRKVRHQNPTDMASNRLVAS